MEQQTVALQPDVNFVPLNLRLQNLQGVLCRSFQCHRCVQHFRVFLDLRQADNVVDEKQQAFAFPFDHGTVLGNVFLFGDHAAAEHFAESLNGRQRCFQLVGNVCGEFLPHFFRLDVVGYIDQQHDRAENAAHFHAGDVRPNILAVDLQQLPHRAALVQFTVFRQQFMLRCCFGFSQCVQKVLIVCQNENGFVVPAFLADVQQCRCRAVGKLDLVGIVQNQNALYHVLLNQPDDVPFVVQLFLHAVHFVFQLSKSLLTFLVLMLCLLFLVQIQKNKNCQQKSRCRSKCPTEPFHNYPPIL